MPGLSFLNKKKFHTTNVKNVEQVWIAEQKDLKEKKRLAELQKQLIEERQILELRQLQAANGHVSKTIDNSLDWMREGPSVAMKQQLSSEEYLLGKIYCSNDQKNKMNEPISSDAKWLNKVAGKNDSFTRAHEDPFVLIKQEENKQREKVINNPIKMDRIKQKVNIELQEKEKEKEFKKQLKKEKRKLKKESKKIKKDLKKNENRNGSDNSSSSDSDDHSLSPSQHKVKQQEYIDNHSSKDNNNNNSKHDSNRNDNRKRYLSNSREGSYDNNYHKDNNYNKDRRYDDNNYNRSTYRDLKTIDSSYHTDKVDKKYGLVSSNRNTADTNTTNSTRTIDNTQHLGPNPKLLELKLQNEKKKEYNRRNQNKTNIKQMSEEEKLYRIKEMENDAIANDNLRSSRHSNHNDNDNNNSNSSNNPNFLEHMRKEVYTSDNINLTSRIDQNKHYRQSSADIDSSNSFMKK